MSTPPAPGVVWEGSARARWAVPTFLVFVLAGVVLGRLTGWVFGVIVVLGGLCVLSLVEVHVQVTRTALRVLYSGPLRFPAQSIALDQVASVEALEVDPKRYGGWGYRGSLKLYRRAALNLRKGPGLRLELADGRIFVVTVDDADQALAALRSLTDRTA